MAINLNPGADPTLVQAAYAASMANVPHDISPIYKQMGESYQLAMGELGKTFSEVAKQVGELGGMAVQKAIYRSNMRARGDFHSGKYGTTILTDRLNEIKQGIKETGYGLTFDPEKRGRYLDLVDQRNKLFSQIELLSNSETFSDDAFINGNFSQLGTGSAGMLFKHALQYQGEEIKNHKNEKWNGYSVDIGFRENGDLFFTLMNPNGKAVTHESPNGEMMTDGDKPMTVDVNNIDGLLVKENLSAKTALNTLLQGEIANGTKNKTKFRSTRFANSIKSLLTDDETVRYLMYEDDLASDSLDKSFAQDLNSMSTFSTELYGSMAQIAVNEGMDIKDTDKVKGISAGDFATPENYEKVKDAILNPTSKYYDAENTKSIFVDWLTRAGSDQFAYGTTQRTRGGNGGGKDYGYSDPVKNIWRSNELVRGKASDLKTHKKGRTISMWDDDYVVVEPGKKYKSVTNDKIYTIEQIWDTNGMPSDLLTGGGSSRI